LNVLATLDWVMFHRRREKTCHQEAPVLPLGARQYALYHLQLNEDQDLNNMRKQLERTVADAQLPTLDFVQLVEFGAGIHAVTSSQPQLQASWRQDVGVEAGKVVGGFIASHGVAATEGARLAQERLETLVDVIATVTPEELNPAYQVLNRVPDTLDTPSNDGVIIVVTRVIAATNNLSVRKVLYAFGMVDRSQAPNHPLTNVSPTSPGEFRNGMPRDDSLRSFIARLGLNSVYGITLATTSTAPDATLWAAGLAAVVRAVVENQKAHSSFGEPILELLNKKDHDRLYELDLGPDSYDAIVFFEETLI